jgi:hypothetical protein
MANLTLADRRPQFFLGEVSPTGEHDTSSLLELLRSNGQKTSQELKTTVTATIQQAEASPNKTSFNRVRLPLRAPMGASSGRNKPQIHWDYN